MKYKLKSIDDIIEEFDEQIKSEYKFAVGDKEKCPSYWHKLLFIKTLYLDTNDWRKIRVGDYWEIIDSLQGIERSKFIYKRVSDYLV
jgi:hypothetical protein